MTRRHDRRSACAFDEASEKASNVIACRLMPGISRDVESRRCAPVLHMCPAHVSCACVLHSIHTHASPQSCSREAM